MFLSIAGASIVLGWAGAYALPRMSRRAQERDLRRRCSETRSLVLTYDDGPGGDLTPRLLDLLGTHGTKATFFLLGRAARKCQEIVDRIITEGHEVGCHSENHLHAMRTWPWKAVADINAGYRSLSPWLAGNGLFRPPCGKIGLATWWALHHRKAPVGWWTIDSGDTHASLPDPQSVVEAVARAGGGVVLLHSFDRRFTARTEYVLRTTELLLQHAADTGLSIRPLGDLLGLPTNQTHGYSIA